MVFKWKNWVPEKVNCGPIEYRISSVDPSPFPGQEKMKTKLAMGRNSLNISSTVSMNEERTIKIEGRSNTNGQYSNSKIIAIKVKIVGNLVRGVSCVAKKLSAAMNILGTKYYYSG